jgi:cysteinyl-tRNA synthetase
MLHVNDEKMSKSLGNFFTIEDVTLTYHPEIIRYFMLSSHYRSTLNYSDETIQNSCKALMRLYQSLRTLPVVDTDEVDATWIAKFCTAMQDDFNTPEALAVLFQLSHELHKTKAKILAATLKHLGGILGLLQSPVDDFLQGIIQTETLTKEDIEKLIAERNQSRTEKNWVRADEIRQTLLAQSIELEDSNTGTIWRRLF